MTWRERIRRLLPYVVSSISGFAIAYLFMFCVVFKPSVVPHTAEVPSVVGLDVDGARQRLKTAGFETDIGALRPDPTVAKGSVSEQSPRAGGTLERGGRVLLTISAGNPTSSVTIDSSQR